MHHLLLFAVIKGLNNSGNDGTGLIFSPFCFIPALKHPPSGGDMGCPFIVRALFKQYA